MSAKLENAIQEKISRLSDKQQQQVMAFIEGLESRLSDANGRRFSFVSIVRSGKGGTHAEGSRQS